MVIAERVHMREDLFPVIGVKTIFGVISCFKCPSFPCLAIKASSLFWHHFTLKEASSLS